MPTQMQLEVILAGNRQNEKKGDRDLEREMKNQRRLFFVGRTT